MAWSHAVYQLVGHFLRPYTFLLLVQGLALAFLWRKCRDARRTVRLAFLPYLALTLISLPAVSHVALGSLEWRYPPTERRPTHAKAIVVLSAGAQHADAVRIRDELSVNSLVRCLHAAEVYHQGPPLPVLVTGGTGDPRATAPPDGDLMRDFLMRQGVARTDLIVENAALSTYENALESRKLLERRRLHEIILVTEASHMLRAVCCFRKQGVRVTPSACYHRATEFHWSVAAFLPDPGAAGDCVGAAHEWLGLAWYWLRGRI